MKEDSESREVIRSYRTSHGILDVLFSRPDKIQHNHEMDSMWYTITEGEARKESSQKEKNIGNVGDIQSSYR